MNSGIYMLEFPDGSFYIGQSVDVLARWSEHRRDLTTWKAAKKIQYAYNQNHGVINFKILLRCRPDYLDMFEAYFIHKLQPKLNTSWPTAHRYDWSQLEKFINNAETIAPIESVIADFYQAAEELRNLKTTYKEAEVNLDFISTRAEELEIEVVQLNSLLEDPDAINTLRARIDNSYNQLQIESSRHYRLLDRVSAYNNLPWYKKLWTKV